MPRRAVVHVTMLFTFLLAFAMLAPAAEASSQGFVNPDAQRVIDIARAKIGDPWVAGRVGPSAFDCSGLVYFVFKQAHLLSRIGSSRKTAAGYWRWFAKRGLASRTGGRPGDLIIYGGGVHIAIYLGHGKAISALDSGVQVHRLRNLTSSFTTFLHVRYPRHFRR